MALDLDLVAGRDCGGCTACCTVMAIDRPEIQKAAGVTCRHCDAGCAIHATRPQLCRDYHCGWRQLPFLDDAWRPDRSEVFVEVEEIEGETAISLTLIGNPLKTVRQAWFQDFVAWAVGEGLPLHLGILGPPGFQGASLPLTTQQMAAAAKGPRAGVKALLELELKRLRAHDFAPRVITHTGHDYGS